MICSNFRRTEVAGRTDGERSWKRSKEEAAVETTAAASVPVAVSLHTAGSDRKVNYKDIRLQPFQR